MASAEGYARPELLAEPDWLWERQDDSKLRIIDCASLDRYRRAHIPGAVGLPVDGWLNVSENKLHVMGLKACAELMEKLGVSDDTTVVAYDDNQMFYATRLCGCSATTATPTPGSLTASGIAGSAKVGRSRSRRRFQSRVALHQGLTSRSSAAWTT